MSTQMRVWDKENQIMGYLDHPFDENWYTIPTVYGNYPAQVVYKNEWKGKGRPENHIIMKCLDVPDVKDNDIYEHDIIKYEDTNWGYGGEYDKIHDGYLYKVVPYISVLLNENDDLDLWILKHAEVIGNKYQNPELLEKCK